MTINFYLDKKSQRREKTIFVYIRGLAKGKTIIKHTGEKIDPKFWDTVKQVAKRSYVGSPELNGYLDKIKEDIRRAVRIHLSENSESIDFEQTKQVIDKVFDKRQPVDLTNLFWKTFNQFVNSQRSLRKPRTIQKYETLKSHLSDFESCTGTPINFDKIDIEFDAKLKDFFITELELTNNTIGKYISTLKTFLSWSYDIKVNKNNSFKKFKVPSEKTDIVCLTQEELDKIQNFDLKGNKRLEQVRDVFVFSCYTGARFSDISAIKREDIKNNTWNLRPYKTKDIIDIPLTEVPLSILSKYQSNHLPLPIISHQRTNDYVKEICKNAEISEMVRTTTYSGAKRTDEVEEKYKLISTHTARRTFVTLSLEKGMRAETVMAITGHKTYKSFKKYISLTNKVIEAEMQKIWGKNPIKHLKLVNTSKGK